GVQVERDAAGAGRCWLCGCVFFFSSRRRHTRLVSDWSSDVCSSDLTGVHGANRLASNSLLEGVVFGSRAGRAMREAAGTDPGPAGTPHEAQKARLGTGSSVTCAVQRIAWEKCGIVRSAEGLREAAAQLERLAPESPEERNVRQVAWLIARCALAREESRGAHFRIDYPEKSESFAHHSVVSIGAEVTFR